MSREAKTFIGVWSLILASCLLSVVVPTVEAHRADPVTGEPFRYRVPLVDVSPSVDGILDDPAWNLAEPVPISWDLTNGEPWKAEEDFMGVFQAVWRDRTLYLAVRIRDDQIDTSRPEVDQKDRLVLYVDREHLGLKVEQYRYIFPVQEDRTYEYYPEAFAMWGPVDDVCEISFDLERVPVNQLVIGFGIEYHDIDAQQDPRMLSWPPEVAPGTVEQALGDFVFEVNLQKSPHQIGVTWGAIKALF